METLRKAFWSTAISAMAIGGSPAHAFPSEPASPNPSGPTTENVEARAKLNDTSKIDYSQTSSIFYYPNRVLQRHDEFEVEPCESAFTAYHRYYQELFPAPDSLLNECALGPLINMNKLMGFDPFGGILNAIKGAMCGFIKNELHDPFTNAINKPMSRANQWINSTNKAYGDWIDENARNLQSSLYDPSRGYASNAPQVQIPAPYVPDQGQGQGQGQIQPRQETPEERDARIREETLNAGGGVSQTIIDADGNEVEYFYIRPQETNNWQDLYNLFGNPPQN